MKEYLPLRVGVGKEVSLPKMSVMTQFGLTTPPLGAKVIVYVGCT